MSEEPVQFTELHQTISQFDDGDWADVDSILMQGVADRNDRHWAVEVARYLEPVLRYDLATLLVIAIVQWDADDHGDSEELTADARGWLNRLNRRYGSRLAHGMRRSVKGDLDWMGLSVRVYSGQNQRPTVQLDVGLFNDTEIQIHTDPAGYGRFVRSVAEEWRDNLNSEHLSNDEERESLSMSVDEAMEALVEVRGLLDQVKADGQAAEPPLT